MKLGNHIKQGSEITSGWPESSGKGEMKMRKLFSVLLIIVTIGWWLFLSHIDSMEKKYNVESNIPLTQYRIRCTWPENTFIITSQGATNGIWVRGKK